VATNGTLPSPFDFPSFGETTRAQNDPLGALPLAPPSLLDPQFALALQSKQPAQAAAKVDSSAAGEEMLRWIKSNNRFGSDSKLVEDMAELIQSEIAKGQTFSLTFGPNLMKSGQPHQLHLFAGKFFKFRLTAEQARRLDVDGGSLTHASGPSSHKELRGDTLVKLSAPQFQGGNTLKGSQRMTGQVTCETLKNTGGQYAIRLSYYTSGNRMSFHYPDSLPVTNGQLSFDVSAVNSAEDREKFSGPLVVFMDLCTVKENNGEITVTLHSETVAVLVDVE
jgi:hypothetical protein